GLILARGTVNIDERSLLSGGVADNGGAIYVDGTRNLTFTQARFENNTANVNGGAIASAVTFQGTIGGSRFHFIGNSAGATGGAIHLDGIVPKLYIGNGTFYDNSAVNGAAVRLAS